MFLLTLYFVGLFKRHNYYLLFWELYTLTKEIKMEYNDKVWKTKKSRINTSERLKQNDFISQLFITYYSLFIIIISIIDISKTESNFGTLTLILSILILVVSVFVFSMNFKERSLKLQNSYIKMDRLWIEMKSKESKGEDISDLKIEYSNLLECSENHSECDYLKVLYSVRNNNNSNNEPFTKMKMLEYCWCKFKRFFFISILFLIPIIFLPMILDLTSMK